MINYTEPLNKRSLLEFSYGLTSNNRESRRNTLEKSAGGKYEDIVDSLSNEYKFEVLTHAAGINYRYSKPKRITTSFGVNISQSNFSRHDLKSDSTDKYGFTNFYPQGSLMLELGQAGSLMINYMGNTQAPTIDQVQPIRDNSDPFNIRVGNPDLKQAFKHSFNLSFNSFKILSERFFLFNLSYSTTQNDFTEFNTVDELGRRIFQPGNINGNYQVTSRIQYSRKIKKSPFRWGLTASLDKNHNTNFINDLKNINDNYNFTFSPKYFGK